MDIILICDSLYYPNSILIAVTFAPRGRTKKYTAPRAKYVKDQDYGASEKFSVFMMCMILVSFNRYFLVLVSILALKLD